MGTWGSGPFDDDTAMDFVDELAKGDAGACARRLADAIRRVAEAEDIIGYGEGVRAVTAAALLAGLEPPGETGPWAALRGTGLDEELADDAILAVERANSPGSELFELQYGRGELASILGPLRRSKLRNQQPLF